MTKTSASWQNRKRRDLPMITPRLMEVLQYLRETHLGGWPFVPLDDVHKRTLRSLLNRDWIFASPGPDGVRYKITGRGLDALRVYEKPVRRYDGICPVCGVRPKHVYPNGRVFGYCRECAAEHKKRQYHMGRHRINPDRLCSCCHERPLHRMSGGKLSTYCTECRHAKRKAEKRAQHDRDLARIAAGEVLLCRHCKQRPRAYTERYVRDHCNECQREYMAEYNDRRRPESQAARSRKRV